MHINLKNILLVLLGISLFGFVTGLVLYRNNAIQAQDMVVAIENQDNASIDTTQTIANLKTFSANHMNASVKYALQGSYNRAVAAAQSAHDAAVASYQQQLADYNAGKYGGPDVYAQGQAACAGRADSITQANCVQAYVAAHPIAAASAPTPPPAVQLPTTTAYQFSTTSPSWAFDAAGITLVSSVALAIISCVALIVLLLRAKPKLQHNYITHHSPPEQHHPTNHQ